MKTDDVKDREAIDQRNNGNKRNKKAVMALVGILSVVLIFFIIFGVSYFNREKKIKQADVLISIEKYEDGIAIYDNLLSKKHSSLIMDKRNLAVELMESDANLKKGLEASEEGDISTAVKFLSKISKDDEKRYELAADELSNIEKIILIDVNQLIEDGKLDEANQIVNDYLKVDFKNVKMQDAKNSIDLKKTEIEEQIKNEEKDKEIIASTIKKQAEIDAINAKKNAEVKTVAINIVGTYQYIIANEANLRDAPTINSSVIGVLNRGMEVYIHDTQIESAERIWCYISTYKNGYVEYGWMSYNTMNYKIQ